MANNRKLKVFLCHSKDDKSKVREIYHRLIADGFDAWFDEENLLPGQDWDLKIRKAVRASDVVVVCLSNGSVTKAGYVQKEVRFALDVADEQPEDAIFLIPAKLEDCQVPMRLNRWQWVNLFEKSGYEKLKRSLTIRANSLGNLVIPILHLQGSSYNIIEPQMIKISAGTFLMGSTIEQAEQAIKDGTYKSWVEREQPQHEVELSEYLIGKYPVTNREYQVFIKATGHKPPKFWDGDQYPDKKGDHPVTLISLEGANAFCIWLSKKTDKVYRLPTEAEWEKASRGEGGRIWPWGNAFGEMNANTAEAEIGDTSPVGQFSLQGDSPYGCADMIGNVWEWCADWFDEHEYKNRQGKRLKDPRGPKMGNFRIVRGGSFNNPQRFARCAYRNGINPNHSEWDYGFRVALSPTDKTES